jgi:Dihaem cytochrome c
MVALHIIGVVTESVLTHDNLVKAIVTGWKRLPPAAPVPTPRAARPVLAAAVLVVLAVAAGVTLHWLSRLSPPPSLRVLQPNAAYQKECGACHYAFNSGLLPASSWASLMGSLREHFGEDASLDAATTQSLTSWLVSNAAETFDTESANRLRVVDADDPYRITSTPYWLRKHAGIPADVFARKGVRGKVNCDACHCDAESGRYDDQAIAIPEE